MKVRRHDPTFERYLKKHNRCLGLAVEEIRTARGLSRSQVAKPANVSVLWVERLETNQLSPNYTIGRIDRIAEALGVDIRDLYQRTGEMTGPPPCLEEKGDRDGK